MKRLKESYTVLIIPSQNSSPRRFNISKKAMKAAVGAGVTCAALLIAFGIHYGLMANDMWELRDLRKETKSQKIQLQSYASDIADFNKQMARLKVLDSKIRVIADIGPMKGDQPIKGVGGAEEPGLDPVYLGRELSKTDLLRMTEDLGALQEAASLQELSFVELNEAMKDRRSLWASTPSIWPTKGWLTSGFGKRSSPFTGKTQTHKGVDVAARRDTPIVATAAGVISRVGFDSGFGKLVKINHNYGMQTLFGHMSKTNVRVGQRVKRGDVIGFVGNTGLSTGPHVHYAVYVKNVPVNPLRYILD